MTIAQLSEATKIKAGELTGKTWKIKIIEGDRQGSSAYYPKEVLESGKHLFGEGTRIFRNHPSANDKWDQPERRIEDIIGWISEAATFDGKDLYANATFIESEQAKIKELAEAGVIAMSIRATGEMTEGTNGMEVKKFTAVHSVDVVTVAGAGGAFEKLVESGTITNSEAEALAEATKEETELELPKEFLEALEGLSKSVNSLNENLVTEKADREAKALAEAAALEEAGKPKAPTATEIAGALREAKLSPKAEARVLASVESGADLAEAVKVEKEIAAEYLAEAAAGSGAGHVNAEENLSEAEQLNRAFSGVFSD